MAHERNDTVNREGRGSTIAPLDELNDYKVADGEPDVRGWDVVASDQRKIGKVHELLVDTGVMQVRYLDVDIDKDIRGGDRDRHILVPIGCARLDDDDNRVLVGGLKSPDVRSAPAYEHLGVTRDFEESVRGCFEPVGQTSRGAAARGTEAAGAGLTASDRFYGHEHYDQSRFFGTRRRGRENAPYLTHSDEEFAVGSRAAPPRDVEHSRRERPLER